jgi:hypothetical protein
VKFILGPLHEKGKNRFNEKYSYASELCRMRGKGGWVSFIARLIKYHSTCDMPDEA